MAAAVLVRMSLSRTTVQSPDIPSHVPGSEKRTTRYFAKGMGMLEKTDRLDGRVIAWFAAVKGSVPSAPASAAQQRLKARFVRRSEREEHASARSGRKDRCGMRNERFVL
jgi:hypothetical protein